MKVAIPLENGVLSQHFGRCQQFSIVEINSDTKEITGSKMLTPPQHEPGVLPAWLSQMGCNLIITGGIGVKAVDLFRQNGIEVISGVSVQNPDEIINAYFEGQLQVGDNTCDH